MSWMEKCYGLSVEEYVGMLRKAKAKSELAPRISREVLELAEKMEMPTQLTKSLQKMIQAQDLDVDLDNPEEVTYLLNSIREATLTGLVMCSLDEVKRQINPGLKSTEFWRMWRGIVEEYELDQFAAVRTLLEAPLWARGDIHHQLMETSIEQSIRVIDLIAQTMEQDRDNRCERVRKAQESWIDQLTSIHHWEVSGVLEGLKDLDREIKAEDLP
jgi:hypothetical protein